MEKIVCHKSSNAAKEFIDANINNWGKPKRFITFFESGNFLLTPYLLSDFDIKAILETEKKRIEFSSLNCGYGGQGPHATEYLLKKLNVPNAAAERYVLDDAIDITFDAAGEVSGFSRENFFNASVHSHPFCGCNLNETTFLNVITAKVYMANPETNNLNGLINCLQVMGPVSIEYLPNPNDALLYPQEIEDFYIPPVGFKYTGTRGVNLVIRGKKFSLFCFVNNKYLENLVNTICLSILKRGIYSVQTVGQLKLLTHQQQNKWQLLKSAFQKTQAIEKTEILVTRG